MGTTAKAFKALQMYAEYAHRVDDGRIGEWSKIFDDDGVMAVRGEEHHGPEGIYAYLTKARVDGVPSTARHLITNVRVDIDGDDATMRSDFTHVRVTDGVAVTEMVGAYRTTMRWRDDEWKFVRHEVTFLLDLPTN
jgi:3-phenylpropionate/cinnamic acid dioxygenase small subunit